MKRLLAAVMLVAALAACGSDPAPTSTTNPGEPQTQQGRLVERANSTADLLEDRNAAINDQLSP
ncbi:MAG: hypothetical protein KJN71_02785 [Acidimicrobiia bacterium]|nr:hypothetical protein [Acidimicrobiia bacterium]NNC75517.1 hypothetical protein [Acidimicrobiia bacterium]